MSIVFTSFKNPKLPISIKIPVTLLQFIFAWQLNLQYKVHELPLVNLLVAIIVIYSPLFYCIRNDQNQLSDLSIFVQFYLSPWCLVTVNVLWFFLTVSRLGCSVVFPDHTHVLNIVFFLENHSFAGFKSDILILQLYPEWLSFLYQF